MLVSSVLLVTIIGLVVGVLIGCVGIGGVLLVPALTYIVGIDIHVAIASCMLSYAFSGAVGAVSYARQGSLQWSMCGWLCIGAMPGAYVGARNVAAVPDVWLEALIAVLILFAGVKTVSDDNRHNGEARTLGSIALIAIGAITGFGSAMSGTGGPLIIVPILVGLQLPILVAVGLSQVIQLPVAALATIGNYLHGEINFVLGLSVAALLMLGVMIGARVAHRVSAALLRRVAAAVMVGVGVLMTLRLTWPMFAS